MRRNSRALSLLLLAHRRTYGVSPSQSRTAFDAGAVLSSCAPAHSPCYPIFIPFQASIPSPQLHSFLQLYNADIRMQHVIIIIQTSSLLLSAHVVTENSLVTTPPAVCRASSPTLCRWLLEKWLMLTPCVIRYRTNKHSTFVTIVR